MKEIPVQKFRSLLRIFERELGIQNQSSCCCGVTITQCHTLMELDNKDGITLNELAERLNLDKSTVSRTVDSLVRSGLIIRTIPDENRRTTILTLSKEGINVCKTINSGNNFYYRQVLAGVPENLRESFIKGFEALAYSMKTQNTDS